MNLFNNIFSITTHVAYNFFVNTACENLSPGISLISEEKTVSYS